MTISNTKKEPEMNTTSFKKKSGIIHKGALLLFTLWLSSCAYNARWTPEKVAPPASLEAAIENAFQAAAGGQASLSTDITTTLPLSRDGAIVAALARNRSLAVEQFAPEIAAAGIDIARAAFDPALTATASFSRNAVAGATEDDFTKSRAFQSSAKLSERLPTGTEVFLSGGYSQTCVADAEKTYSGSWSAGINQSLLRGFGTNVNLVNLRQAHNQAAISQHELRGFILQLVQQSENAYWDLVLANETLKIRRSALTLAEQQLQTNLDMIEAGKLAQDSAVSARADLASRKADLVSAEADVRNKTIALIQILNPDNPNQWNIVFQPQDAPNVAYVDLNPSLSAVLADRYRPELAQSRLSLANKDLEVVRTKKWLAPQTGRLRLLWRHQRRQFLRRCRGSFIG